MKRNYGFTQLLFMAFMVFAVGCFCPQSSYASPPENIQLKYNLSTQTLSVAITHDTILKGSHYIKYIEIKKNGSVVSINTYTSQPTGGTFTYYYKISAIEEDTFLVTATCNLRGSKAAPLLTVTP